MARKCEICGKAPVYGNNISHSHRRTRTRWLPNLKKVNAVVNGERKKIKVCMSCLHANKVEIAY